MISRKDWKTGKTIVEKKKRNWVLPTLTKWEIALQILPFPITEICLINKWMICKCKISKLRDCNYKILHRILATPVIIAAIQKKPDLKNCAWCAEVCTLKHMLLHCPEMQELLERQWIFGVHKDVETTQLIWVINFVVYKALLVATSGKVVPLETSICNTCKSFSHWLECLELDD